MQVIYEVICAEILNSDEFVLLELFCAVSQAVFMKDRVDGLVSGSPDTVVVLTKGIL